MRKQKIWLVATIIALLLVVLLVAARLHGGQKNAPVVIKETPVATASALPQERNNFEEVLVNYVIDGDTVVLEDGRHVRYIGMDTPELQSKYNKISAAENIVAEKACNINKQLVLGKKVLLEKDVEEFDKYGRTLAYVWVDGKMANEELLRQGVAVLMTIPPDVKYVERLKVAAKATNN